MVASTNTANKTGDYSHMAPEILLGHIWEWLENVHDPEVPVLSVLDLGVVRSVTLFHQGDEITGSVDSLQNFIMSAASPQLSPVSHHPSAVCRLTPTYTGCPAMHMIAAHIKLELAAHGIENVVVEEVLSPAWTTDWMRESGKQKLLEYGIAPPQSKARMERMLFEDTPVPCPQCGSTHTERIAEFGSTACKSLHRCLDCREPFDYFKCH